MAIRRVHAGAVAARAPGVVYAASVHPVRPQGDVGLAIEVGRLTIEAIRAAYDYLDQTIGSVPDTIRVVGSELPRIRDIVDQVVDEGVPVGFVLWPRKSGNTR